MEKDICSISLIHPDKIIKVQSTLPSDDELIEIAELFSMFADYTRTKIISALRDEELCVCDIAKILGMTKSAISHQLKTLRMVRLVKFRKEGKVVYYSLNDDHILKIYDLAKEHIME